MLYKTFSKPLMRITTSYEASNQKKHCNCSCSIETIVACESVDYLKQDIMSLQTPNTLSPALCVGYATFTDRGPVSPRLVFDTSTTSSGLCSLH